MLLNRQQISAMIPHGSSMCMLEQVDHWDAERILCRAHPRADNPMRESATLGSALLIEYAAQAAAVHGALLEGKNGQAKAAYLGAIKKIELLGKSCNEQDDIILEVTCALHTEQGAIYDFIASQQHPLIRGRLIINHH